MRLSAMPRLSTPARSYAAIACIPCSVAARVCPSSFCSHERALHDAPFARPLLEWAVHLYHLRPRVIRLDAAYWGLRLIGWIHATLHATAVVPWNRHPPAEPLLPASDLDQGGIGPAAVPLNASLAASFCSFICKVSRCVAGRPSPDRSR
jgi:hypothetical protein